MARVSRSLAVWVLVLAVSLLVGSAPSQAETNLVMGTGLPGGNYNKFGQLFAKVVNASTCKTGIHIQLCVTDGSVSNINGLIKGNLQLGLAQADMAYLAWAGKGPWKKTGPQKNLRTVYELYTEALTCVASVDAGIRTCADLSGKRVALGAEGSGTLSNALQALASCSLKPSDLCQALKISAPQAMRLMYKGKIEAFFYTVGHPNQTLRNFLAHYGRARLVPLTLAKRPNNERNCHVKYFIWMSDYPFLQNRDSKLDTFGIKSFLMTTDKVPAKIIHKLTRLYLDNLDYFKARLSPMLELEPPKRKSFKDLTWNVSAPYHDGVQLLFKEMGIRWAVD